jgi:hypothetical protein
MYTCPTPGLPAPNHAMPGISITQQSQPFHSPAYSFIILGKASRATMRIVFRR